MKKILHFAVAAASALTLAVSCERENIAAGEAAQQRGGLSFTATIEEPALSRAALVEGAEAAQVVWEANDFVALIMEQAFCNTLDEAAASEEPKIQRLIPEFFVIRKGTEGSTSATFTMEADPEYDEYVFPVEKDNYYAVYPYKRISTQDYAKGRTQWQLELPASQNGGGFATLFKDYGAMVAMAKDASFKDLNLAFKNLHAVLKLSLTGDKKLASIIFRGNAGEKVAGTYTIDFAGDDITRCTFSADAATEITSTCAAELSEQPTEFRLLVPAGLYADGYTVEFVASDGERMAKSVGKGTGRTIGRSTIYTLPTVDFRAKTGGDVDAAADWLWQTEAGLVTDVEIGEAAGATDLGQAANCFMVNAAGTYKFPIARGDGSAVNDALAGKYISFKASAAKGNAVIALRINNQIAWSWHIWATDEVGTGTLSTGHTLMDRNLGATTTEIGLASSLGLYYQWGRKDPFIGANDKGTYIKGAEESEAFSSLTADYIGNDGAAFATLDTENPALADCIQFAIVNPMTFIYSNTKVGEGGTQSWFTSDYKQFADIWGGETGRKSEYDPCPAGYRVPLDAEQTWAGYTKTSVTFTEYGATDNSCGIIYPFAGNRNYNRGNIKQLGAYTYMAAAKMHNDRGGQISMYNTKTAATAPSFMQGVSLTQTSASFATGYSVRCEKIE